MIHISACTVVFRSKMIVGGVTIYCGITGGGVYSVTLVKSTYIAKLCHDPRWYSGREDGVYCEGKNTTSLDG